MFIYLAINMSENQIFKELDIEHKRDYMWRLFAPRVENIKDWARYLETFVLGASEEQLNRFYDAMMSWDSDYVAKLINDIKTKKAEVIKLKNNFAHEVMEYKENKTKRDSEKEMDEQLQNI